MSEWLQLALSQSVVRRALKYGLIVGTILIGINHGDALLLGEITATRVLRMALTVLVPYCVSTLSSIEALRTARPEVGGE
jgi:hypothetical protein